MKITRRQFLWDSFATPAGAVLVGCGGSGTSSNSNAIEIFAVVSGTLQENLDRAGAVYHTRSQYEDLIVDDISYRGRRLSGNLHFYVNEQFPVGPNASIDDMSVQLGDRIRWVVAS